MLQVSWSKIICPDLHFVHMFTKLPTVTSDTQWLSKITFRDPDNQVIKGRSHWSAKT